MTNLLATETLISALEGLSTYTNFVTLCFALVRRKKIYRQQQSSCLKKILDICPRSTRLAPCFWISDQTPNQPTGSDRCRRDLHSFIFFAFGIAKCTSLGEDTPHFLVFIRNHWVLRFPLGNSLLANTFLRGASHCAFHRRKRTEARFRNHRYSQFRHSGSCRHGTSNFKRRAS